MRITELLGKSIVSADTGEKPGHVEEVLLDSDHHHVVGVLVTDGVLSHQKVLPFGEVQTVGADAVIARTVSTICDASAWVAEGRPAHRSSQLRGKPVVTAAGERVGLVEDLVAEDGTGAVIALELAGRKRGASRATMRDVGGVDLTRDVVVAPAGGVVQTGGRRTAARQRRL